MLMLMLMLEDEGYGELGIDCMNGAQWSGGEGQWLIFGCPYEELAE